MKKFNKIYVEITNRCNLNCSFCRNTKRMKKDMSLDEFTKVLEKIKDYTNIIYLHVKGEPFLNKNIIDMIHKAEEYDLKVNITTNGTLLKYYSKALGNCNNISKINISLHSENNISTYLEDIFESINDLSNNTIIIFRLWTLKNNELDEKSTKIVDKIKKYYKLSPKTVDKIKYENNIKINPQIYVDKDNEFIWPTINNHKSCGYCNGLKTHIGILVDGTIIPCCLDGEGIINLGNIFKDDLETILSTTRVVELRKSLQDRNPIEELCQSCTYKEKL